MFRQSIDPKGGFPPRSGKKSKKSKKKQPIKRRKKTRDPFSRERQQERAFQFGEVRSGLSGRSIYNPADFIRFHQTAQFNQQRDEAEKSRRGGTFTGTSIGEEAKVREAQEVDRRFKERQLGVQERFVGAVEKFIDKANQPQPQQQEVLQELRNIKQEVIEAKKPRPTTTTSIPTLNLSRASSSSTLGEADIEDITTPIPERRKPEDDISFLSIDRSQRTNYETPTSGRPRPDRNNPSLTTSIPSQHLSESSPTLEIEDLERTETAKNRAKKFAEIKEGESSPPFLTPQGKLEPEPEPEPVFEKEEVGKLPEVKEEEKLFGISTFGKLQQETKLEPKGDSNEGYTLTNPEYSFIDLEGKLGKKKEGVKYQVIKIKGDSYQFVDATNEGLRGWSTIKKDRLEKLIREGKVDFNE